MTLSQAHIDSLTNTTIILLEMDRKVLNFLSGQRVCSLTTLLKDGSPHAAALHFSHKDKPLEIYVQTENTSRKCQALLTGKSVKGSFVVGFSEKEFKTLQMDGSVKAVKDKEELLKIHRIHYKKHPGAKKWKDDPATLFLVFKPAWWRYTEYKPKFFVLSSEKNGSKK